jgi:hypothetical protein
VSRLNKLSFKFNFKLRGLKTVRMFFKIRSRNFSCKWTNRLEHYVEINFDLNLIFKLRSLQTVRRFFQIRSCDFSRKSCCEFRSYRSRVIVVERSGCGCAERVPPHRADVGEPIADDPEGGAGNLTSI